MNPITVIADAARRSDKKRRVTCLCGCGVIFAAYADNVARGLTKSCGCVKVNKLRAMSTTHGLSEMPIFFIWSAMIQRCTNPKDRSFARYGGRGIAVCERWETFANFFEDMGHRPPGLTLDRRDNNGHYSLDNCRWATATQQMRNMRSNRLETINGDTRTLVEWAEIYGVSYGNVKSRLFRGRSLCEALEITK